MRNKVSKIKLSDCVFKKDRKALFVDSQITEGFPSQIEVYSEHTKRTVVFFPITEGHPQFDYDFWDGEMAIYEPDYPTPNVRTLTIHHGGF